MQVQLVFLVVSGPGHLFESIGFGVDELGVLRDWLVRVPSKSKRSRTMQMLPFFLLLFKPVANVEKVCIYKYIYIKYIHIHTYTVYLYVFIFYCLFLFRNNSGAFSGSHGALEPIPAF